MKITCCSALVLWCFATAAICRPAQPQILPLGSGVHLDAGTCDSKPDWSASNFLREDCYNSVLDVFLQDYRPHPQAKFNFYSGLYPPPPGSNKIQTPRRYTTKSCTLALVMLYRFGSAELPGTFKAGHSHTDLATFDEIYTTARRLEENCIVGQGRASRLAWEPVGATKSLGLFFWATDSRVNHDPRFKAPFSTENLINMTVAIPGSATSSQ